MTTFDQNIQIEIIAAMQEVSDRLQGISFQLQELIDMAKSTKSTPPSMQSDGNKVQQPVNAIRKPGGKSPKGGK